MTIDLITRLRCTDWPRPALTQFDTRAIGGNKLTDSAPCALRINCSDSCLLECAVWIYASTRITVPHSFLSGELASPLQDRSWGKIRHSERK